LERVVQLTLKGLVKQAVRGEFDELDMDGSECEMKGGWSGEIIMTGWQQQRQANEKI